MNSGVLITGPNLGSCGQVVVAAVGALIMCEYSVTVLRGLACELLCLVAFGPGPFFTALQSFNKLEGFGVHVR